MLGWEGLGIHMSRVFQNFKISFVIDKGWSDKEKGIH